MVLARLTNIREIPWWLRAWLCGRSREWTDNGVLNMINLLSVNQKKNLKPTGRWRLSISWMVTAFVLISFVLAILAAGAFFDGKLRIKAIEAAGVESQLTMMDASQVEKSMSKDNTLCLDVNNFYSRRISAADAALLLANALPRELYLIN